MRLTGCFILCLILFQFESIAGDKDERKPSSIVTIPGSMAIEEEINISFIFINILFDVKAKIEFLLPENKNISFNYSFKNGENRVVSLRIPRNTSYGFINDMTCKVSVENKEHGYFYKSARNVVLLMLDNANTFIQSDKPIYKPMDTVSVRVMATTRSMKSLDVANMDYSLSIINDKGNTVRQIHSDDKKSNTPQKYIDYGILEFKYLVPSYANFGKWNLKFSLKYLGREITKSLGFTVKEYVLPIYKATIQGKMISRVTFEGKACAEYTFGKPVDGYAILDSNKDILQLKKGCAEISKTFSEYQNRRINVSIFEHGTGKVEKAYWENRYRGDIVIEEPDLDSVEYIGKKNFVKNFPHLFKFEVKSSRSSVTLKVSVTFKRNSRTTSSNNFRMDLMGNVENNGDVVDKTLTSIPGVMQFQLKVMPENADFIHITAQTISNGTTSSPSRVFIVYPSLVSGDKYLSIYDLNSGSGEKASDQCSRVMTLTLKYNTDDVRRDETFHYQYNFGMSKISTGTLKKSNYTKTISENSNGQSIVTLVTKSLIKDSKLPSVFTFIVFYEYHNRIISDSVEVKEPAKCIKNKLVMSSNFKEYTPGSRVELRIQARDNSVCALSLSDKSLDLLVKSPSQTIYQQVKERTNAYLRTKEISRSFKNSPENSHCILIRKTNNTIGNNGIPSSYRSSQLADSLTHFLRSGIELISDLQFASHSCIDMTYVLEYQNDQVDAVNPNFRRTFGAGDARRVDNVESSKKNNLDSNKPRVHFPESWLFDLYFLEKSPLTVNVTSPDTITSWKGSAFCVNKQKGISTMKSDIEIKTFLHFFLKMNLPYSLKVGEKTAIAISVYNYERQCMNVALSLRSSRGLLAERRTRLVCACPGKPAVVYYHVIAKKSGKKYMFMKASSSVLKVCHEPVVGNGKFKDSVMRFINVKAEGNEVKQTLSRFECFNGTGSSLMKLEYVHKASELVEDSSKVRISVIGDILGPTLSGLKSLLQIPCGCGEQNMLSVVPSIYVLRYLDKVDRLPEVRELAKRFVNIGYQREFQYQHEDHSFSAFGKIDKSGSTWLTAFVLMSFYEAKEYIIDFEENKLHQIVQWLTSTQKVDGCYPTLGTVLHQEMVGGAILDDEYTKSSGDDSSDLTAFVLIALITSGYDIKSDHVTKARDCLIRNNANTTRDAYRLAVLSRVYGLLGETQQYTATMQLLQQYEMVEDNMKHWRTSKHRSNKFSIGSHSNKNENKAISIEITSYIALSLFAKGNNLNDKVTKTLPIVKWITTQRNFDGGFISTQDTIMALKTLTSFAQLIGDPATLQIDINNGSYKFEVNRRNALVLQRKRIKDFRKSETLKFKFNGTGCVLYQAHLKYNVKVMEDRDGVDSFSLEAQANFVNDKANAAISVCIEYKSKAKQSNMVLVEVELPSGWIAINNHKSFNKILMDKGLNLKRYEIEKEKVVFYFDKLTNKQLCFEFAIIKQFEVLETKESSVFIYDYYNKGEFAKVGFTIKDMKKE